MFSQSLRFLVVMLTCSLGAILPLTAQQTVTYGASSLDFVNPERGFYRYTETRSGSYTPLTVSQLADFRNAYTPFGGNYSVVSSLAFRYFFLEDFTAGDISQAYLDLVAADFAAARDAGIKIIPRFAYTDNVDGTGCDDFICPPYGDAPKNIVLDHITQLAPVLEANKDVIAVVQMGFIGVWGENYYTDHFGDASGQGNGKLFDADWENRNEVLAALLTAVPVERQVQVRYPQLKQRFIYGIDAPTSSAALTAAEAFNGSDKARIGLHNDCLLASADDFGTYNDYGNDDDPVSSDTATLKPYFAADSRYVAVGGETCSDGYSPQNDCSGTDGDAFGDTELRRMHYSYLNVDFNREVNNDWQDGGCIDDIKLSLGYRLELSSATLPAAATAGTPLPVTVNLQNVGFAAPFNARGLELILRETTSGEIWRAELEDDPRNWSPETGLNALSASPCLPSEMPAGDYELLLHLPDPMTALYGRPDYSIRLASLLPDGTDVWEASTGFNQLGLTISVAAVAGSACTSTPQFLPDNVSLPIDLLHFAATPAGKNIHLRWTSAQQENFAGFTVERSGDGNNFSTIGTVTAPATSSDATDYSLTDNAPLNGTNFYRLRMTDLDGSTEFSSIISAEVSSDRQIFRVWPNPTSDRLQLQWAGATPPTGQLSLIDVMGRQVLTSSWQDNLSLKGIPSGTYTLLLKSKTETLARRVVIRE